jgi:zinc-ribbon family
MRIIMGTRTKVEADGKGEFFCPACKSQSDYIRVRVSRYFTLFFIPLFRIRKLGEHIRCVACQRELRTEVTQLTREQIQRATAPWVCPACGNRNSATENACVACGADRKPSPPPMPGQPPQVSAAAMMSPPPLAGIGPAKKRSVVGRVILIVFLVWIGSIFATAFLNVFFAKNRSESSVMKPGHDEFQAATKSIASGDQEVAHGNTPQARELAAKLSEGLGEVSKTIPTVGKPDLLDQTGGKFLVFCQLNEDACVFLVHVPNLRHFDANTQKSIAKMCYLEGCLVIRDSGVKGIQHVAVATRGALLYSTAMVGAYPPQQPNPQDRLAELDTEAADVPALLPYFTAKPATDDATPPPPPKPAQASPSPSAAPATSAATAPSAPLAPETPAKTAPSATPSAAAASPQPPAGQEPSETPAAGRPPMEARTAPSWVPIYPALAKPAHGTGREEGGIVKGRTSFDTSDPLDKVKEFYENKLKADGFEITADKATTRIFENAEIAGNKDGGKLALRVAIHQMKTRTFVTVTYEGPEKPAATP